MRKLLLALILSVFALASCTTVNDTTNTGSDLGVVLAILETGTATENPEAGVTLYHYAASSNYTASRVGQFITLDVYTSSEEARQALALPNVAKATTLYRYRMEVARKDLPHSVTFAPDSIDRYFVKSINSRVAGNESEVLRGGGTEFVTTKELPLTLVGALGD